MDAEKEKTFETMGVSVINIGGGLAIFGCDKKNTVSEIDARLDDWEARDTARWIALQIEMKRNLIDDLETAKFAIGHDPFALQYCSERLRNNREFMFWTLYDHGLALKFAPDWMKNSKRWAGYAVEDNIRALRFVSERLKNDAPWLAKFCDGPLKNKYVLSAVVKNEVRKNVLELSKNSLREWRAWKYTKKWRTCKSRRETLNQIRKEILDIPRGGHAKEYSRMTRRRHRHH